MGSQSQPASNSLSLTPSQSQSSQEAPASSQFSSLYAMTPRNSKPTQKLPPLPGDEILEVMQVVKKIHESQAELKDDMHMDIAKLDSQVGKALVDISECRATLCSNQEKMVRIYQATLSNQNALQALSEHTTESLARLQQQVSLVDLASQNLREEIGQLHVLQKSTHVELKSLVRILHPHSHFLFIHHIMMSPRLKK